jgi:hypothetical protein
LVIQELAALYDHLSPEVARADGSSPLYPEKQQIPIKKFFLIFDPANPHGKFHKNLPEYNTPPYPEKKSSILAVFTHKSPIHQNLTTD